MEHRGIRDNRGSCRGFVPGFHEVPSRLQTANRSPDVAMRNPGAKLADESDRPWNPRSSIQATKTYYVEDKLP